jgi:hypothetical protein
MMTGWKSLGRLVGAILLWNFLSPAVLAQNKPRKYIFTFTCITDRFLSNIPTVVPFAFNPLPLGSSTPQGWLKDQLQLMADGLGGHEMDFYEQVSDSVWLGGSTTYSDLNEGFGYWYNALVPLAYGANDQRLQQQVLNATDYILTHQFDDGWLGPEATGGTVPRNIWGRMPVCLAMIQLAEALNGTDSQTQSAVLDGLHRYVNLMHSMLADNYSGYIDGPGQDSLWPRARAHDMMISLEWLIEHDPRNDTDILYESLQYLLDKAYSWSEWYTNDQYIFDDIENYSNQTYVNDNYQFLHGVNVGQGLKASAVIRRFTQDDSLVDAAYTGVNWTFTYHGTPSGSVIGDERESGLSPTRGTELCTVVETMYSLAYLYQSLGDKYYADRCELAAFNALPVMVTPDWWAHQYIDQTNQPVVDNLAVTHWFNTNSMSQTYSIEPDYPCCAVNHPQGYPKYVANQWVGVGDNGIAHALLGPGSVNTTTGSGTTVSILSDTFYPFSYNFSYSMQSSGDFDFYIRVPGWADQSSTLVSINSGLVTAVQPDSTSGLHHIPLKSGSNTVQYSISTDIRVESREGNTVAIYHGNILYALPVSANMVKTTINLDDAPNPPPQAVQYTYTWYAAIDPSTLSFNMTAVGSLPNPIWDAWQPPMEITAMVCPIDWPTEQNWADDPPESPSCTGDSYQVSLVPYASSRLHMAQLPVVSLT